MWRGTIIMVTVMLLSRSEGCAYAPGHAIAANITILCGVTGSGLGDPSHKTRD